MKSRSVQGRLRMSYDPQSVVAAYEQNAQKEDASEKGRSMRVELPREFIKKYLQLSDLVLDAGGGTGINTILMAERCRHVTLLDITPGILELARENVEAAGVSGNITFMQGDITDLHELEDGHFSFVVCVGDALSYVLDQRFRALRELVRVARPGSILILGCDSRLGFMRLSLALGRLDEALEIYEHGDTECGMGPRTHTYTVQEMTGLLEENGCRLLELASTPTVSDTLDVKQYHEPGTWDRLKKLELELCTKPELLGVGLHLLFVARKEG
jgi:SAM-dependent methyltransferase